MSWRLNSASLFPYKVDEIEKAQYTLLRERSSSALKFLVDGLERSHDSSFYIPLPNVWEGEEGMMEHVRRFPMPSVATDPFDSSKPRIKTQGNTSDNKEDALTVEHSSDNAEKYQCNSKHIAFTSDDSFNLGQQLPSNVQLSSSQALLGEKESGLKVESNDLILALSGAECKDTIHFSELPSNELIPELAGMKFQDNHYLAGASCSEHDDKKKIQSLMAASNYLIPAFSSTTHSEKVKSDGNLHGVKRFPVTSSNAQEITQAEMLQTIMTIKEENIKTEKVELTKSAKAARKLNSSEITQEGHFWIRLSFIKAEIIRSRKLMRRLSKKLKSKFRVEVMNSSQELDAVKEKLCELETTLQEAILEKQGNWYADSYTLSPCEVKELEKKYEVKISRKIKPASDIIEVQKMMKSVNNFYYKVARLKANVEKKFVCDGVSNVFADHAPTDCPKTKKSSRKKAKDVADGRYRQFLKRLSKKPNLPVGTNTGRSAKQIICESLHNKEKPNTDFMTRNTAPYPCETILAPTSTTHSEMVTGDGSLLSVKRFPVTSSNAQEITQAEMLQTVMTIKEENIETEKVELTKSTKASEKLSSSEITQEGQFWIRLSFIKAEIIRSTTFMRRFNNKLRKPKKVVKALSFSQRFDTMKKKLCTLETALQEAILEKQGNWYADSYTLSPCEVKELKEKYEVKITKRIKPTSDIIEVQSLMKAANNYYHTVARLKANVERKCVSERVSNVLADDAPTDCPKTKKSSKKKKAENVADNQYRKFLSRLFDKPNLPLSTNTGCSAKHIIRECLHTKEKLNTAFMTRNRALYPHEIIDIETSSHGSSGAMTPPKTYLREIINVEASAQMNSSTETESICVLSSDDNDGENFDIISISSGDDYTHDSAQDSATVAVTNDKADTNLDVRIVICESSKPSLTACGSRDCNLQNEPDRTDILTEGSSKSSTVSTRDDFHHLDDDHLCRNCTGIKTETSTLSSLCTCSEATTYSKMSTCECSASASKPVVQSHSLLGSSVDLPHPLRRRDTIKSEVKDCLDVSTVSIIGCSQQFLENEKCHWDKLQDVYTAVLQSLKEAQNLVKSSRVRDQRCAKWAGQVSNQCMMKEFEARIQGFGNRFRELEVENQRGRYCKQVSYRNLESGSKVKYKSLVKSIQHLKHRLDLLRRTFKSAKRNYSLTCQMLGQQGKMVLLQ